MFYNLEKMFHLWINFHQSSLEPESKKLVYLTSNKIEDITRETLDKKFYKEERSHIYQYLKVSKVNI